MVPASSSWPQTGAQWAGPQWPLSLESQSSGLTVPLCDARTVQHIQQALISYPSSCLQSRSRRQVSKQMCTIPTLLTDMHGHRNYIFK